MKKKQYLAAVGAVLVVGLFVALRPHSASPAAELPSKKDKLSLTATAMQNNPVDTARARKVRLAADLEVVGSVSYDQDHYAVVGPLVGGRVARLRAGVGDAVRAGQVLAEIESAEIGQAQAAYLSARARSLAAQANLARERELAAQRISSEREREVAEAQAASDSAELRAARERLRAFGLADPEIASLDKSGGTGGRVALRAPIAGTVVARMVTLGQAVERATDAFKLVNLAHLWVLLDLYEKDLDRVHAGQKVELRTESLPGEVFHARVAYVNPLVDEKSRTANVRIELENEKGKLRPGQFVTAHLIGDSKFAGGEVIAVPQKALKMVDGKRLVFVRTADGGFERRTVEIGFSGGDLVEVRHGVAADEEVVTDGAFLLKSELLR
jgi:membrane fusion protein, heavy metal efflux system